MKLMKNAVASTQREKVGIETVTPEHAKQLLGKNISNRPLRSKHVDSIARDMAAGAWMLNNDAICVATDGTLLNGQHRLSAVVKCGKPIKMLMAYGFSPETYKVLDSGKKRSVADNMNITTNLAAAIKMAFSLAQGQFYSGNDNPNFKEIETLMNSEFGTIYDTLPRQIKTLPGTSVRVAAIAAILKGVDPAYVILEINSISNLDYENVTRGGQSILRSLRNPVSLFYENRSIKGRVHKAAYLFKHFQQLDRDVKNIRMSDREAEEALKIMGAMFKTFLDEAKAEESGEKAVLRYASSPMHESSMGYYDYSCGSSQQVAGV